MKKTIFCLVIAALTVTVSLPFSSQGLAVEASSRLMPLRDAFINVCRVADPGLECTVRSIQVRPKTDDKAWSEVVQGLILARQGIDGASALLLSEETSSIYDAFAKLVNTLAVYKKTKQAQRALAQTNALLERDVYSSSGDILAVSGSYNGPTIHGHRYLAIVDTKNLQVVILSGGYTE